MAINSVNSSTSAESPTVRAQAQPTKQSSSGKPPAQVREGGADKAQSGPPKPVVNLQGQTTGRIINTQA